MYVSFADDNSHVFLTYESVSLPEKLNLLIFSVFTLILNILYLL